MVIEVMCEPIKCFLLKDIDIDKFIKIGIINHLRKIGVTHRIIIKAGFVDTCRLLDRHLYQYFQIKKFLYY